MLQLPLKRLRFNQISPFASNNKKPRNDIATERLSRQDSEMELNQDPIGVKSDGPTETMERRQEVRENEPARERQEMTGRETTAPLADAVNQLSTLLTRVKISHGAESAISPFDGTYSATQFFQTFDRKMEDASMEEQEKLLRLPNYLVRQPLELFRKLRLADRSYFQVRQTLLDLYPESSEASFAKYFAMKLTGQANLETYYREKTAMGLQLGLPQEVILETLTEGLPFSDQRLVRVVPPENLGEWFRLVQRIHGPSVPATRSREDQPPTMSGPYHSTSRRPGAWNAPLPPFNCKFCGARHWHSECRRRPIPTTHEKVRTVQTVPKSPVPISSQPRQIQRTMLTDSTSKNTHEFRKIITIRPYRVPICDQQEIRNQIQQMLENGIIEQSFSPFSSPITLVTKRDKTKRFCIDYRKVNELISSDVHPLPRIEDILDHLAQAKYFSTADISSAYWQVPIHPDSRPLLAFATFEGLYQPTRLPFGLKTSPQIYERAISQVLQRHGLDCVAHYFDDFIIYSNTLEEHQNHLRQFFAFCEAEKLQLNFAKCEFFKQSINFLGYTITAGTITPLTRNTDIIHAIKQPHNRKTLQSFLGAVNVYNKFIPEYARLRAPLNNLLKKDVVWNWNEACQEAFIDLKGNLTQHPILHLYKEGLPCQVYCDASTLGIAGILKQVHPDGNIYPVQYFSRTLRPHEINYSISELECLAIVESVEKFRIYLMGRKFTIFSDHHALQWLKTIKNPSGRLFRWSLRLSSYEYEVRYIKGKLQYEADLLSRNPFCGFLDATLIKTHQPPPSKESSLTIDHNGLHTVSRKGVTKIILPKPLIQQLLQTVHTQYNHPGISQMSRIISTQYYWQGMSKDIKQKVKTCPTCQLTKRPVGPTYGELSQPPESKEPFDLLSLDTIGGFAKYGNTKIYLHVVVDHFPRYAWAFPSKSTSTTTYQQVLKRVFQDGSPKRLLTDRAPAFTSPKFRSFLLNRNIHPLLTTSNNPQANGLCERLNATLTGKLRLLHLENPKVAWTKLVKKVTLIYNKTPHSTTGFPPIYLMFGILPPEISNHNTPYPDIDKARKIAHTRTQNKHLQDKNTYDQRHKQPHFEVGDLVHLDPAIFATRRFTSLFPDVKNCKPDNQFNHITPLPKDIKQENCEPTNHSNSTIHKVLQGAERYWKTLHALTVPRGYYRFDPRLHHLITESRRGTTRVNQNFNILQRVDRITQTKDAMAKKVPNCELICYADDISIICWNKDLTSLKIVIEEALNTIELWCIKNNLAKTPLIADYIEAKNMKYDLNNLSFEDRQKYNIDIPFIIKSYIDERMLLLLNNTNETFTSFFNRGIPNYFRPNFHNTQFVTNHGNFGSFLERIRASEDPGCFCGCRIQDSTHLLLKCPAFQDYRLNNYLRTNYHPYPEIARLREIARSRTQNKHKKDKETFDKQHRTPHFEVNDLVLVKNYRHPDTVERHFHGKERQPTEPPWTETTGVQYRSSKHYGNGDRGYRMWAWTKPQTTSSKVVKYGRHHVYNHRLVIDWPIDNKASTLIESGKKTRTWCNKQCVTPILTLGFRSKSKPHVIRDIQEFKGTPDDWREGLPCLRQTAFLGREWCYDEKASVTPWWQAGPVNKRHYRRIKQVKEDSDDSNLENEENLPIPRCRNRRGNYVKTSIDKKEILVKCYEEGKAIAESAESAGINKTTATSIIRRYKKDG
ncbi:hypothetical protein LAZ67_6003312 [Cordylochernes scorpioides]|uniref:RNA-directed DNA polymerase n=1 Tax=Cordylochernes scorpioides TaxID=51811 RepID=A0ABY6KNN1_9ARAC|nr:hypothetical protein LAZ67_6003312 [Cordylochernes scorpioides]